jgi:hypothetical protein
VTCGGHARHRRLALPRRPERCQQPPIAHSSSRPARSSGNRLTSIGSASSHNVSVARPPTATFPAPLIRKPAHIQAYSDDLARQTGPARLDHDSSAPEFTAETGLARRHDTHGLADCVCLLGTQHLRDEPALSSFVYPGHRRPPVRRTLRRPMGMNATAARTYVRPSVLVVPHARGRDRRAMPSSPRGTVLPWQQQHADVRTIVRIRSPRIIRWACLRESLPTRAAPGSAS